MIFSRSENMAQDRDQRPADVFMIYKSLKHGLFRYVLYIFKEMPNFI